MDVCQQRALHHKRHDIAQHILWNDNTANELRRRRLITKNILEEVDLLKDTSNFTKMVKYLELVEVGQKGLGDAKTLFTRIATFIGEKFPFLEDHLVTECRAERGELPVESYIKAETGIVVDDEFAAAMRSDRDKREFEYLISARLQVNKEIFRFNIAAAQKQLDEMLALVALKEAQRNALIDRVTSFVNIHTDRLQTNKRLAASNNKQQQQQQQQSTTLEQTVASLVRLSDRTMSERSKLLAEKKKALNALHATDAGYSAKLETEFSRSDQPIEDELEEVMRALESAEQTTKLLSDRLRQIQEATDKQHDDYDSKLHGLKRRLETAYMSERRMRQERFRVERELESAQKAVVKQRSKSQVLDVTRKLGYVKDQVAPLIYGGQQEEKEEVRLPAIHRLSKSLDLSDSTQLAFLNKLRRQSKIISSVEI